MNFSKLFTISIILYPLFSLYSGGISSLTIADIVFLPLFGLGLLRNQKNKENYYHNQWVIYVIYFIFYSLTIILYDGQYSYAFKNIRFLVYIASIAFLIPNFFEKYYGINFFRNVCRAASIFGIIQAIGIYVFHFYISGTIRFLTVVRDDLENYGSNYTSGVLRVRSFFGEPAHLAAYLALGLIICLFEDYPENKKIFSRTHDCILITLAMIFSVSSTAYYLLVLIWGIFFINYMKIHKIPKAVFIRNFVVVFIIVLGLYFFTGTDLFKTFYNRNFSERADSYNGRMSGYGIFNFESRNLLYTIFGNGFVDSKNYGYYHFLPSIPLFYWRMGVLGLVMFAFVIIVSMLKCETLCQKTVLLILTILGIGTQAYASYTLMLYMSFILCVDNKSKLRCNV